MIKICTKCHAPKNEETDFYMCAGLYRSECKKCTSARNVIYQRRMKAWKTRYGDDNRRREYMRDYYSKNKEKFQRYRDKFKADHPKYYHEYFKLLKIRGKRKSPTNRSVGETK